MVLNFRTLIGLPYLPTRFWAKMGEPEESKTIAKQRIPTGTKRTTHTIKLKTMSNSRLTKRYAYRLLAASKTIEPELDTM